MTVDPYRAAADAAAVAFGAPPGSDEEARLRAALAVQQHMLLAAGVLQPNEAAAGPVTADDAAAAAKVLAAAAGRAGFPRYDRNDDWRILLDAPGDVDLAYRKAAARLGAGDEVQARDLAAARRVLTGWFNPTEQDRKGGDQG